MTNWQAWMACGLLMSLPAAAQADIFRWDNGQLIPGTEGITPGPGVQLDHHELAFAVLYHLDLTDSRFDFSNLTNADLRESKLTSANLTEAVVTGAFFPTPHRVASRRPSSTRPRAIKRRTSAELDSVLITSPAGTSASRSSPTAAWSLPRSRTRTQVYRLFLAHLAVELQSN